tara:strand:- start:116 stop:736 length:621 start_codon:yes stop_codon:yes gene_type:complete
MQKEPQIFTSLQRQDVPINRSVLEDLEGQVMQETVLRPLIRELLAESIVFRELDSPLAYWGSKNRKRLAYCETDVTELPDYEDAYFTGYQEMERYGKSGRRLKKPRKGQYHPGVSDPCIIGFLDYHQEGEAADGNPRWHIDYLNVRQDHRGEQIASKLVDEFFQRYVDPDGGYVHFGKMMQPQIGHLKDKMAKKYPDANISGAVYY